MSSSAATLRAGGPEPSPGFVDHISGRQVRATPEETGAVQVFARRLVEDYGYRKDQIQTHPQYRVRARPSDEERSCPVGSNRSRTGRPARSARRGPPTSRSAPERSAVTRATGPTRLPRRTEPEGVSVFGATLRQHARMTLLALFLAVLAAATTSAGFYLASLAVAGEPPPSLRRSRG